MISSKSSHWLELDLEQNYSQCWKTEFQDILSIPTKIFVLPLYFYRIPIFTTLSSNITSSFQSWERAFVTDLFLKFKVGSPHRRSILLLKPWTTHKKKKKRRARLGNRKHLHRLLGYSEQSLYLHQLSILIENLAASTILKIAFM